MNKEMIISSNGHETVVAILEDDLVAEIFVERERHRGVVGNVYKGRVSKVLPGMQSSFIDLGLERVTEVGSQHLEPHVHWRERRKQRRRPVVHEDAVEQPRVHHRRRERAHVIESWRERNHAVSRYLAVRGLQADDTACRRRYPNRTARVGAKRRKRHARRDADGRPAAAAAGRP